jgi:hypothetical protein
MNDFDELQGNKQAKHERSAMAVHMGEVSDYLRDVYTSRHEKYVELLTRPDLHDVTFSVVPLSLLK